MSHFLKSPFAKVLIFVTAVVGLYFLLRNPRISPPPDNSAAPEISETEHVEKAPEHEQKQIIYGPARLVLDPGTELHLLQSPVSVDSEVFLIKGKVSVTVRPLAPGENFKVRTVNVTAGVRGTQFTVAIIGDVLTVVQVIEGHVYVEATSGAPVTLEAGQSARIHGSWEPEVTSSENQDLYLEHLNDLTGVAEPASNKVAEAGRLIDGMGAARLTVKNMLDQAQQARDIIKITCLNDKLNQIDVAQRAAREHLDLLRKLKESKTAAAREFNQITILSQRVKGFVSEAGLCSGENIGQSPSVGGPAPSAARILSGEGIWNNNLGYAGPISLNIDLDARTYTGRFKGSTKSGDRILTLQGTCGGDYHGDATAGNLDGWIEFIGTDPASGRQTPGMRGKASGILKNRTITGTFERPPDKGDFRLTLR